MRAAATAAARALFVPKKIEARKIKDAQYYHQLPPQYDIKNCSQEDIGHIIFPPPDQLCTPAGHDYLQLCQKNKLNLDSQDLHGINVSIYVLRAPLFHYYAISCIDV